MLDFTSKIRHTPLSLVRQPAPIDMLVSHVTHPFLSRHAMLLPKINDYSTPHMIQQNVAVLRKETKRLLARGRLKNGYMITHPSGCSRKSSDAEPTATFCFGLYCNDWHRLFSLGMIQKAKRFFI